jgi:hypothetical protein
MIIAVTLYTKKASYYHIKDVDTLNAVSEIANTAAITKITTGLNGRCQVLIIELNENELIFDAGEKIVAIRAYTDTPTDGYTREDVFEELNRHDVSVLAKFSSENEKMRARFKKNYDQQKVILMRHSLHKNDTLTEYGRSLAYTQALLLREHQDLKVICTPANRCVQTAQIVADVLGTNAMIFGDDEIIDLVAKSQSDWLIVTHQPIVEEWSSDLGRGFSPKMAEHKTF